MSNALEQFDADDYMPKRAEQALMAAPATQAMVGRQAQEVQMAMMVAKMYPRDTYEAFNRIMQACDRRKLAEEAMYEFPRGGTKVTGPSIRLAEVLAQNWGNVDFGIIELEQKKGESHVMAYAWDLQTNTRQTKVFTVKHEMKAKGAIKILDDPRDIYEMVANNGARRVRACILGIIPGDIVDAAIKKCEETIITGHKDPLADRIRNMIAKFLSEYGINKEQLEAYAHCKTEAFTEMNYLQFTKVFRSLKDGMSKPEDYFDIRVGKSAEMASQTEEEFKKEAAKRGNRREQPAANTGTDQSELSFT